MRKDFPRRGRQSGQGPRLEKDVARRQWKDQAVWSSIGVLNARTEALRFGP